MMYLLVLLLVCYVASERPDFRNDYVYEKAFATFYKLHMSPASWHEAKIRCEAEGSDLLIPETLDEADAMPALISRILSKYSGVYVGLHDLYSERFYTTVKGKTMQNTVLSLLWEKNEPKISGGRCLAMHRNGRFYVNPCKDALPFVCKKHVNEISYNKICQSFDPRWKPSSNNSCFFVHVEPQTWYQAYTTCMASGGHLLVMSDHIEAKSVRDLFKEIPEKNVPDNNFAFLGFSDLLQRHHYRTVHDQKIEEMRYSEWDNKCPEKPKIALKKRCGGVRRNGLLTTGDCDIPAMFFCEKPLNVTAIPKVLREKKKRFHSSTPIPNMNMGDMDYLLRDVI